jgi:hypothetical protein
MDLVAGQKFMRWTVLATGGRKVPCRCDCGTERLVDKYSLLNGVSRSCGCLNREVLASQARQRVKHPVADGDRFTRWTVLDSADRHAVLVRCDCGTEQRVPASNLIWEISKSCGCYKRDHPGSLVHGDARKGQQSLTYQLWSSIIQRCCNPSHKNYLRYGGRGITIWAGWRHDYPAFSAYLNEVLGPRPEGYTLDRYPDNDGNYEPGNLRWATMREQSLNRSPRRRVLTKDV